MISGTTHYWVGSLPVLFGAVAWLVARENGTPGGISAFLWGLVLGPIGLLVVALLYRA